MFCFQSCSCFETVAGSTKAVAGLVSSLFRPSRQEPRRKSSAVQFIQLSNKYPSNWLPCLREKREREREWRAGGRGVQFCGNGAASTPRRRMARYVKFCFPTLPDRVRVYSPIPMSHHSSPTVTVFCSPPPSPVEGNKLSVGCCSSSCTQQPETFTNGESGMKTKKTPSNRPLNRHEDTCFYE